MLNMMKKDKVVVETLPVKLINHDYTVHNYVRNWTKVKNVSSSQTQCVKNKYLKHC